MARGGEKLRGEPRAAMRTQIRRRVRTIAMVVLVASWGLALSVAVVPAASASCAPANGATLIWIVKVRAATTISRVSANSGEAGGSVGIRIDGSSAILLEDESINKFGSNGVQVTASDHITVVRIKLNALGN